MVQATGALQKETVRPLIRQDVTPVALWQTVPGILAKGQAMRFFFWIGHSLGTLTGVEKACKNMDMEEFKETCGRILGSLPFTYQWEWDDALNVVMVSFDGAMSGGVWGVLTTEFEQEWDFLSFVEAAESLSRYLKSATGIFPGQSVFTLEGNSDHVLFALWWPWGDGETISLRIGVLAADGKDLDREAVRERLTTWFAV